MGASEPAVPLQGAPPISKEILGSGESGGVVKGENAKKGKKRKKRQRGQKAKHRVVISTGETAREIKLGKGNVRPLDILRRGSDKLPRKTRDLLSRMEMFGVRQPPKTGSRPVVARAVGGVGVEMKEEEAGKILANSTVRGVSATACSKVESGKDVPLSTASSGQGTDQNPKNKRFEGMQAGENFEEFSARLRRESKKMILDTARKGSHQREKKREYFAKRKERLKQKKRRRRGDLSDSDVEEGEDEEYEAISHFPSYWQEILRNNGRPVSEKRRKRLRRAEEEHVDAVSFGEQVERPPQLSVLPVKRGRK